MSALRTAVLVGLLALIIASSMSLVYGATPNPPSAPASTPAATQDLAERRLELEQSKLELERAKLDDERARTAILKAAELRISNAEPSYWMRVAAAVGTPLSILGSLVIALIGYLSQARATRRQLAAQTETLKAQFRLKAAEIAMDARSAAQIHNKAKALAALFPDELGSFGEKFDPRQFKLGQTVERRQALIELLAAHPNERKKTLETWALLYPKDKEDWLKPLLDREGIQ